MRLKSVYISQYKNLMNTADKTNLIRFKGNKHKVRFAKEIIPTVDAACFEAFRPMFEFTKLKC